jgi:hypothetical protein
MLQRCFALRDRHSSVVQQSAQQLMQLLRWQLQQAAQRSTPPSGTDVIAWEEIVEGISLLAKQTLFDDLVDRNSGVCVPNLITAQTLRAFVLCWCHSAAASDAWIR